MKIVKLSLVAALTAGALATTASAGSLEDAIKNVDISGMARLRYEHKNTKTEMNKLSEPKVRNSAWKFKSVVDFKIAIDDNFFGVLGLRYDRIDNSHSNGSETITDDTFNVRQAFLGYKADGTTVQIGKQEIGSFFTDDMAGTGVKVINTDLEHMTFAGYYMDSLENDKDIAKLPFRDKQITDRNLYGAEVKADFDVVNFGFHYANIVGLASLYGADADTSLELSQDTKIGLKGQYVHSSASHSNALKTGAGFDSANYYAVEANTNLFNFDGSFGYVRYDTKVDAVSIVALEDKGHLFDYGEQIPKDYIGFTGKNQVMYGTLGYTIDQVRIGGDYLRGWNKAGADYAKTKYDEKIARVSYKYNKNLNFSTYYSRLTTKTSDSKIKSDEIRFEAKYKF